MARSELSQLYLPTLGIDQARDATSGEDRAQANKLASQDRAFHDWYRFVLSFPPHLVRSYIQDFALDRRHAVLDPFCGTGTTLVESRLCRLRAFGLEVVPFAHLASSVKVDWSIDPDLLASACHEIARTALEILRSQGIDDSQPHRRESETVPLRTLPSRAAKLLITGSISPLPLHKTLVLLECLREHVDAPYYRHGLLALGKALVTSIGNLRFGPEVGVGKPKQDVPVVAAWLAEIYRMVNDLRLVAGQSYPRTDVYLADARQITTVLEPSSVDAVITSPPYPNEKDYSRTTRLESVVLGLVNDKAELRQFKRQAVRSNTRSVYIDDADDTWVADHAEIQDIAHEIERRRVELGKTSGFEKQYGRLTKLYFGGMARHLAELRAILRPGARLAYVVGDQASYLGVMIRTGRLLAGIAQRLGYETLRIDLFRTRFATATKEELREEVVVLRWAG